MKVRTIRDIRKLFKHEKEDYYKTVRIGKLWSDYYIKYKSDGERNKTLSTEEYLNKVRPYLKDIIRYLKKYDT